MCTVPCFHRLHPSRKFFSCRSRTVLTYVQRVVALKDQRNKKAHGASAQVACEAAGAVRTVASLTREDDCCAIYSETLDGPLRRSNESAVWSNGLYALSQSIIFFVIALMFWYGSVLVSELDITTFQFFVGVMVRCPPPCRLRPL